MPSVQIYSQTVEALDNIQKDVEFSRVELVERSVQFATSHPDFLQKLENENNEREGLKAEAAALKEQLKKINFKLSQY